MAAFSPPAPFLCVLLCVSVALQRSDLRLAYVTHNSFLYYSCSQDPQPCSISSLTDCICKDIQLSTLHRLQSHLSPVFQMRRLTVWFTSPSNAARLLNNSEVRHLTLIYCGSSGMPPFNLEGYFAVHHLERLTVVNLPQKPFYPYPDLNRAKNGDPDRENNAHLDTNRYNTEIDTNLGLITDIKRDFLSLSPAQVQDIFLGREIGAEYYEQARLGIIHKSVLEGGAVVKAYTVKTHIDSSGALPFPELHLPKLPETSVIYVTFVY
ncbi:caspase 8 [Sarotherodon galilaeus]